jgi:hypothetical protein
MTTKAVLVGLSPDTDSIATITWAAEYAGRLDAPLRVILADGGNLPALYNAAAALRARYPHLSLSATTAEGGLADTLLDRTADAHLVVVDREAAKAGVASTVAAGDGRPGAHPEVRAGRGAGLALPVRVDGRHRPPRARPRRPDLPQGAARRGLPGRPRRP